MGTVLEIDFETAKRLREIAEAQRISVQELLLSHVPGLAPEELKRNGSDSEAMERAFEQWADSFPSDTAPLSDEAISRESVYRDR